MCKLPSLPNGWLPYTCTSPRIVHPVFIKMRLYTSPGEEVHIQWPVKHPHYPQSSNVQVVPAQSLLPWKDTLLIQGKTPVETSAIRMQKIFVISSFSGWERLEKSSAEARK